MAALDFDDQPAAALALAQRNVALQREAIDLWLLARSARAANQFPDSRGPPRSV